MVRAAGLQREAASLEAATMVAGEAPKAEAVDLMMEAIGIGESAAATAGHAGCDCGLSLPGRSPHSGRYMWMHIL
jgi:hypothetical protein